MIKSLNHYLTKDASKKCKVVARFAKVPIVVQFVINLQEIKKIANVAKNLKL